MRIVSLPRQRLQGILVVGDILVFILWVVVGLATHRMTSSWLLSIVRITAPFLIGWFVVAPLTRSYDLSLLRRPAVFFGRSVLCWLLAVVIGLALRATLFGSGFNLIFAGVTVAFTALFVLSWRALFTLLGRRWTGA